MVITKKVVLQRCLTHPPASSRRVCKDNKKNSKLGDIVTLLAKGDPSCLIVRPLYLHTKHLDCMRDRWTQRHSMINVFSVENTQQSKPKNH